MSTTKHELYDLFRDSNTGYSLYNGLAESTKYVTEPNIESVWTTLYILI